MSLRLRLTLFFSAFIAVILSAVALSVYALTERSLEESIAERARQALVDIRSEAYVNRGLEKLPGDIYRDIQLLGSPAVVRVRTPNDLRLGLPFEYNRPRLFPLLSDADLQSLVDSGRVTTRARSVETGEVLLVMGQIGTITEETRERTFRSVILVGVPASEVNSTLNKLSSDLGVTVVLAFIAFAIGVWLLSRQVLAPLQRVTHAAARVTSRDLSHRVPVPRSHDEIREMAITLNRMLDRLQESFETQRRFTADASHELRTPVTAIVGHSNYLLRRTSPDPEQVDSLTVIRREAERMAKLVNDLLELARADAGFPVNREPMNLLDVVEAVHMEVAPVAGNAEIVITSPQPLLQVLGDASRLKQVVLNLVQNALNAGATRMTISLMREKDTIRMEFLDNGPGIPENALPHLFDRFYRVDGARSTRGNGSGLGLAIVKWIVQQHGGTVEVESRLGEGSVFTVCLPALDTRDSAELPPLSRHTAGELRQAHKATRP
ncbi:MAG: ATP-binding protein [Trueperaceae bacterium]